MIQYLVPTVAISVALSIGFGAAWKLQDINILKLKADHDAYQLTQARSTLRKLEANTATIITATNDKVRRDTVIRRDAVVAVAAGNGLRITSTDAVRAAQADANACFASIAIYDIVLNEVVTEGGNMALEADQWESDALMLKARLTSPEAAK